MNKLTICKGENKFEILLENLKFIIGSNYEMKFEIQRTIKRFCSNTKPSEYAEEKGNKANLMMNEKELKAKDISLYFVNKDYSLIDDFKLTSKSLILKYFEVLFSQSEFFDTINTLNIMFESLSAEIMTDSPIGGTFVSMVPKQLIKLLTPIFMEEELLKDEFDLSLENLVLLQLELLAFILEHGKECKTTIIIIEIPKMTKQIYTQLTKMKGAYILTFINEPTMFDENIDSYYICEGKCVDIADENQLFNIICDNNLMFLNLKEGREYMKKYLFEKEHINAELISKILKSKAL